MSLSLHLPLVATPREWVRYALMEVTSVEEVKTLWFTKSRRAKDVDDYETWIEGGVMPTMNAFDNGDVRTTIIIFHPHYHDGARVQGDTMNTLTSRMGTGGNNVSMVATLMRMREGKPGGGKGPLISEDKSLTIATSNDQTLLNKGTVRRLTPVECERLQGFPDDWTAGQSDSTRYKQMGNAVAVPVVEWLIGNISDIV
jgi:site-specific DNA-cytosine methylase